MNLILKRISAETTVRDIEEFIAPALKGGWFKKTGIMRNLRIQMLKEAGSVQTEFHARVSIEPDAAALRVIKKLNRKPCRGKPINVLEYHFRHRDNDRRQDRHLQAVEHRKADRRRKNLEAKDVTAAKSAARIDFSMFE